MASVVRSIPNAAARKATGLFVARATFTLAQLNAHPQVLPPVKMGSRLILVDAIARVAGSFTTGANYILEDTAGTDILTYAQAQLTDGAVLGPYSTGVTRGAGFGVDLGNGAGLQIIKSSGTAFAGGTSIAFTLVYGVVTI